MSQDHSESSPATSSTPTSPSEPRQPRRRKIIAVGLILMIGLCGGGYLGRLAWLNSQRAAALQQSSEGQFDRAEPELRRALERSPDDVEVLKALIKGVVIQGKHAEALTLLNRWRALVPNDPKPFLTRLELVRTSNPRLALEDGLHLLKLENVPDRWELQRRVAGLHITLGEPAKAEALLRKCLSEKPDDLGTTQMLAQILHETAREKEASKLVDSLLRERPDSPALLMLRAAFHLQSGQPSEAIPLLERVVEIDPTRQRTGRYQLALAYAQADRTKDANRILAELRAMQEAEVLNDAYASQPENASLQVRTAEALLDNDNLERAFLLLERIQALRPRDRTTHRLLATYYEKVGRPELAENHRKIADSLK